MRRVLFVGIAFWLAIAPAWFVHMDRNNDGDISRREFLGDSRQFRAPDTNGDDFIDRAEALAVESSGP